MRSAADRTMDQLFDLAVVLGEAMTARLAAHGLTPARAELLWVLHGSGPRTQRALSEVLTCTPRNVTGLVDALAAAGFAERAAHPTDRRAVLVRLTDRGRALIAEWDADRAHGTEQLLDGIPAADLEIFGAVLGRVLERLHGSPPDAPPDAAPDAPSDTAPA